MVLVSINRGVRNFRASLTGPISPGNVINWVDAYEKVGYITLIKFKYVTDATVADRYVYANIRVGSNPVMLINVQSEFPQPASTTYTYFIAQGYQNKKIGNFVYLALPKIYAELPTAVEYNAVDRQMTDSLRDLEFMTTNII